MGFIKKGGVYLLSFKDVGWNKSSDIEPELIDIDSDGKSEIIIESDGSGNQGTDESVTIYKLFDTKFRPMFTEGLAETYGMFPYSYSNIFYFIKDSNNPKLLAIVYRINTHFEPFNPQIDDEDRKAYFKSVFEKYGPDISKTFKGEYVFRFDGSRYICSKTMYDYRQYLREYLK